MHVWTLGDLITIFYNNFLQACYLSKFNLYISIVRFLRYIEDEYIHKYKNNWSV